MASGLSRQWPRLHTFLILDGGNVAHESRRNRRDDDLDWRLFDDTRMEVEATQPLPRFISASSFVTPIIHRCSAHSTTNTRLHRQSIPVRHTIHLCP